MQVIAMQHLISLFFSSWGQRSKRIKYGYAQNYSNLLRPLHRPRFDCLLLNRSCPQNRSHPGLLRDRPLGPWPTRPKGKPPQTRDACRPAGGPARSLRNRPLPPQASLRLRRHRRAPLRHLRPSRHRRSFHRLPRPRHPLLYPSPALPLFLKPFTIAAILPANPRSFFTKPGLNHGVSPSRSWVTRI